MPEKDAPRVLKYSELRKHPGLMYIEDRDWLITKGRATNFTEAMVFFDDWLLKAKDSQMNCMKHCYPISEYNKTWRCWSEMPTRSLWKSAAWKTATKGRVVPNVPGYYKDRTKTD